MKEKQRKESPQVGESKPSRREFLGTSATVGGGIAAILATGQMPAFAQERELRLLSQSHFVPESDKELDRQLEEFGKQAGVKVRADHVAHLQVPAVLAGEVSGQKGHDVVQVRDSNPDLYGDHLEDLGELYEKVGAAGGGWTDEVIGKTIKGVQTALPWYFISLPLAYRMDLLEQVGEKVPKTWDDLHRAGTKLKKLGHPLGIALSNSNDSNNTLRGLLWSYGGKLVESDSKTVAVNSKETVEAFKLVRALYKDTMEAEVLAWDDRNNNVCLISGKCSVIFNPISAYRSAERSNAQVPGTDKMVHEQIMHVLPPEGPAGLHTSVPYLAIGVWKFAKEKELAKEFLEFHFQEENQNKLLEASTGYNQPVLADFANHEIFHSRDTYKFALEIGKYSHARGWPGVPTGASQTVFDQFLLPTAFAECATDRLSPEDAVNKLEGQLKRIYRRFNRRA